MKILYNPPVPHGAPIGKGYNGFISQGEEIDSLLPGEVKQYSDAQAEEIMTAFSFITEVSVSEAEELLKKPIEKALKCDKCDFSTDTKIALISHQKKHEKEAVEQAKIDSIPVAHGAKVEQAPDGTILKTPPGIVTSEREDITNGVDKDGVEWYGEGRKEHRESMGASTPFNKGRFGGQPLSD